MSSHHFVKEGQEPALILTAGFLMDDIGPLLEWAPLVIAFPNAIESVLTNGIHVDHVVLSKEESAVLDVERSISQIVIPDPVVTLPLRIQTAIEFLSHTSANHLNIWVDSINEISSIFSGLNRCNMRIGIVERNFSWSIIEHGTYRKWLPASSVVFYNGRNGPVIANGTLSDGVITVEADGFLAVNSDESFWVGEPRNTF
jgi:hypothetical protein